MAAILVEVAQLQLALAERTWGQGKAPEREEACPSRLLRS